MNTMTTKDVAEIAVENAKKLPDSDNYAAYDFFGTGWPTSANKWGETPVATFGLGGVRTSRRANGFGGMGDLSGILDETVLGIPVWILGAGAFVAFGGLKMLGIGKK